MKLQLNRLCLAWRSIALSAAIALPLLPAEAAAPSELDREPVAGENLPYQPGDGETMRVNPPAFRWLPAGGDAVRYRLKLRPTRNFHSWPIRRGISGGGSKSRPNR